MNNSLLLGIWRLTVGLPELLWQREVAKQARDAVESLGFMSEDHHAVRNYVVQVLPRLRRPVPPATISQAVDLPLPRTLEVLSELEKRLFFLVRNQDGDVSWAFPVTAESTGHGLSFSTGERLDAA